MEKEETADRMAELAVAVNQARFYIYSSVLVGMLLISVLWQRIFIQVADGHHAVLYDLLRGGTVTERVYSEGLHLIWPWNRLISYETRLQQRTIKFSVLSEEGLELGITVTIRYTLDTANLGYLHRDIGIDYFDRLVKPDVEGHLRHTFGGLPAHKIYSSAREVLQEISRVQLLSRVVDPALQVRNPSTGAYLRLEELKLVGIELPAALVAAINEKQRHEQLTLEYKYRLEQETKESERKRIEAAGVRDYSVIAGKVSADVLRWRGIEAALELAKSTNAKTMILGNSPAGMPIMLNFTDTPTGNSTPNTSPVVPPAVPPRAAKTPTK